MLPGMSIRLHPLLADVEATALRTSSQRVAAFLLAEASHDPQDDSHISAAGLLADRGGVALPG
jgi:hypothetical protein